jgi:hypothetical protein
LSTKPKRTAVWRALALFLLGLWSSSSLSSQIVTLVWDANSEPDIGGYFVYYGDINESATQKIDVGNNTTTTVFSLVAGKTYRFFATAYNTSGLESDPSDEVRSAPSTRSAPSAQAIFIGKDTATGGSWKGVYGADGYDIINHAALYPGYAIATPGVKRDHLWAATTIDVRALQKPAKLTDRIAACWYSTNTFQVDLALIDGLTHRVALYCVDWDRQNRAQIIEILDAANGSTLSSQSVTAFASGQYLIWDVNGHVIIRLTRTGPYNAVLSGIFFDLTPPAASPRISSVLPPQSFIWPQGQAARLSNGQFEMSLEANADQQFEVEASIDLIHWLPLPHALGSPGLIDSEAGQFQHRFYRLIRPSKIVLPLLPRSLRLGDSQRFESR